MEALLICLCLLYVIAALDRVGNCLDGIGGQVGRLLEEIEADE